MNRTLALCADDYGQTEAVNRGVLQLAGRSRLTEVSCMVNGRAWRSGANDLQALPGIAAGTLRAGLHFNLSEGWPLSPALASIWPRLPPLPRLIALAHLGRLPRAALRDELQAQLAAFEDALGHPPAHLDGHQHVHHLPGVRDLVLAQCAARPGLRVRDTSRMRGAGSWLKRRLIEATGGRVLGTTLRDRGLQANSQLLGVYGFRGGSYRSLMQRWLAALPMRGALLFCHPGAVASTIDDESDPIASARALELAYLDSDDFIDDLRHAGACLGVAV